MEYIYAALLLHKAGKAIKEENVKAVLNAAGIAVDDARVKAMVAASRHQHRGGHFKGRRCTGRSRCTCSACRCSPRRCRRCTRCPDQGREEGRGREWHGRARRPVRVKPPINFFSTVFPGQPIQFLSPGLKGAIPTLHRVLEKQFSCKSPSWWLYLCCNKELNCGILRVQRGPEWCEGVKSAAPSRGLSEEVLASGAEPPLLP